jgi:hypothetical protein
MIPALERWTGDHAMTKDTTKAAAVAAAKRRPLNQRNVQHLKGAFIKAGREPKRAIPFTRFKVPAIFIWAFGWLPELAEGRRSCIPPFSKSV